MADYIEREVVDKVIDTERKMYLNDYGAVEVVQQIKSKLCNMPNADVQPVRKWVNDNIFSPSVDGDYLVLYQGYFNVFERFRGKWFDEKGVEVDTKELLWWQELPPMPEAIKG